MAQLSFPILPDGLVVDALVNLEAAVLLPLFAAGTSPAPIQARGLLDTASNVSGVAMDLAPGFPYDVPINVASLDTYFSSLFSTLLNTSFASRGVSE